MSTLEGRKNLRVSSPSSSEYSSPSAAVVFLTTVRRAPDAPRAPGVVLLRRLLSRAWRLLPAQRRNALSRAVRFPPACPAPPRLAADIHLISDAEIAALNARHLGKAGPTDVLSFPMGEWDFEREALSLGDIVVSYETARREARARGLKTTEETARYIVHGFLHLVGYEDDTPAKRRRMTALQERILKG